MENLEVRNRFEYAIGFLVRIMSWIAALFLAFMTVSYAINVVGRYCFNAPILGADEIVSVCLASIVFLALGYTNLHKEHVSVDLVTHNFPAQIRLVLNCFACLLGVIFWGLVGWQAGMRTWEYLFHKAETTDVISIPLTPFVFLMTIGCLILVLQFFYDAYKTGKEILRRGRS